MWLKQPEWFLLIPVFIFLGWYLKNLFLWRPLRVLCLLLFTLILVDPHSEQRKPGVDLWVLVDKSDSAQPYLQPQLAEWRQLLEESKGEEDSIHYIDFAGEATLDLGAGIDSGLRDTSQTRIPLAVEKALAERDPTRATKILLFSDGYSTVSLEGMGARLRDAKVKMLYRLPPLALDGDSRVTRLNAPTRIRFGEPLLLDIETEGKPGHTVRYLLKRNEETISSEEIVFDTEGKAKLRLIDRFAKSGSHRYSFHISDPMDPLPGNNYTSSWVKVEAGPRILLLTPYSKDPLVQVLNRIGLPVESVSDFARLNEGSVQGARTVILNNVPAHVLPTAFLDSLNFFVTHQGGGLVMCGGKHSFGSGGYYNSPIDSLLPISMELKEDHKKLAAAMAIVLDRSGSMGATVANGMTKMDMANAGAADTVGLMGGQDAITVYAVDSEPHQVVPLTDVTGNQDVIQERIRSIVSMGGGIFVYTGLKAAWEELKEAEAGQKHVILFSDAADSEEPGKYKELISEMTEDGATISVIGLGTDRDPDAEFLKDIAKRGNGRIFFSKDPNDIPAFFAQETVAVTRSAFIDEPVGTQAAADWMEISPKPIQWPQRVDGYNLSYLRPRAASALITTDEYRAPLVAFWRRGTGRSAAITFPVAGLHSDSVRAWPGFGDFVQTLSRWLVGNTSHRDVSLMTRLDGNSLALNLYYDVDSVETGNSPSPSIAFQQVGQAEVHEGTWERISPGHYRTMLPLESGAPYLGAVIWGEKSLPFGPISVQENIEWARPPTMLQALKDAAEQSRGGPITLLETIWQSEPISRMQNLRLCLLIMLGTIFLAEALWFRLGKR